MERSEQHIKRDSIVPYRVVLFFFGGVFAFFSIRDLLWSGGVSVVSVLAAIPAIGFIGLSIYGSEKVVRSLYKRRMVPEKSDQND